MRSLGWTESPPSDEDWDVAWGDTAAALFKSLPRLKPFQRVNHFPRPASRLRCALNVTMVYIEEAVVCLFPVLLP